MCRYKYYFASSGDIPQSFTSTSTSPRASLKLSPNMKLSLAYIAIASTATIVAATSCTSDNALPWPYASDGSGTSCNGDATCEALAAEGQCNSLSLIDDTDTTCVEKLKKLKRAVDLDCESNESCLFFVDNSLLCLDQATGVSNFIHVPHNPYQINPDILSRRIPRRRRRKR
jgi:hypothetical protein